MPPPVELSILVVTHDHAGEIDDCLEAAVAQARADLRVEVIVADNASVDGTPERVRAHGAPVRLLPMGANRGFAAGMNAAFAASSGRWVLLLNPDCAMDPGCAGALRDHLLGDANVAMAAAVLRNLDGSPQLFARRELGLGAAVWAFTDVGRRFDERWRGGRGHAWRRYAEAWTGGPPRRPLAVDSPAAACVLARRESLEPRPFDERFPLFFNDTDLCARLRAGGRRIEIVPAAGATHGYGTSIARAARADYARLRAEWVVSLRRYAAARAWSRSARATLWGVLLGDAVIGAARFRLLRRGDPRHARGTLGGLGLPGGPSPLFSRVRGG